jgi:hypothetical protein
MNELLTSDIWKLIRYHAKISKKMTCAIAYVTDDRHIKFGEGDTLVVDASNEAIGAGQTDASLIDRAFKRNAKLYSLRGLHAKVFVLDSVCIVGSANLSVGSESNFEAAIQTDNPTVVSSAKTHVSELSKKADKIDRAFVERILKIPVQERKRANGKRTKVRIKSGPSPRTWLVGLKPTETKVSEQVVEQGRKVAEKRLEEKSSDISTMHIKGNRKFRKEAKNGDLVVTIWNPAQKSNPDCVYRHARILHRKEVDGYTVIYVEETEESPEQTITWPRFKKICKQAGVTWKPSQWSMREIDRKASDLLHELWS